MVKVLIIVWSSFNGYHPMHYVFDTQEACDAVQASLERLADKAGRPKPTEIFRHGHIDTAYFIPCDPVDEDSFEKIHSH